MKSIPEFRGVYFLKIQNFREFHAEPRPPIIFEKVVAKDL